MIFRVNTEIKRKRNPLRCVCVCPSKKKINCIWHEQTTYFYWHYNYVFTTGVRLTIAYHISIFLSFYTQQCFYLTHPESSSTSSRLYRWCIISYRLIFLRRPKPLRSPYFRLKLAAHRLIIAQKRPTRCFFKAQILLKWSIDVWSTTQYMYLANQKWCVLL